MKFLHMLAGVLLFCSFAQAADDYHIFTDTQGREIVAKMISLDAQRQVVAVELKNGKKGKIPLSQLSDKDKAYVHEWSLLETVRSPSKFRINCERRTGDSWSEKKYGAVTAGGESEGKQEIGRVKYEKVGYEIKFENRNAQAVNDLTLEYCIYYEQQVRRGQEAQPGVLYKSVPIGRVDGFGKTVVNTDPVCVYEYQMGSQFINSFHLEGEVVGLSLRLYVEAGDEKTLVREVKCPDSLPSSYAWITRSKPVGEN